METLYRQIKDEAEKMQRTVQRLANDVAALERKLSLLDKIAFASEQDCRRKEQQIQDLTAEKDRIEKLIAYILNGESYSKLNQIVKENVKVVLSEKRVLISISFAAVIQTLKVDPQMIKLIQNISRANDGEQYKDNDINITQYFESNKDRILDLAEKHYENLVEALTNNAIKTAADASSNSTLSLPQSSSTLNLSPYNQSDSYRIEESEGFQNSKGDIADIYVN
jgi:septal ring factor EnvC (AmiA/AmiB activator)